MITTLKTCFKCGEEKPYSEFYKHSKMADGHLGKCKTCTKRDVIDNRQLKVGYYREYDRQRGSRQSYSYTAEYRATYPNKYAAHCAVNNAVRDGKLVKPSACEVCGFGGHIVGHHDDYSQPLVVRWLCQPCHTAWHKAFGEGKNATGLLR